MLKIENCTMSIVTYVRLQGVYMKSEFEQAAETNLNAAEQPENNENTALSECLLQVAEWKDKYFRLGADFQNFKKRLEKEQASLKRTIQSDILLQILSIVDNFDRAFSENKNGEVSDFKAWIEGFELIQKELYRLLERHSIKEIAARDDFDPELHEAVMQVASETRKSGEIVEVLQKGYLLDNHVLRPAKVSVAQ
jgi:molecular chaperone GrpE